MVWGLRVPPDEKEGPQRQDDGDRARKPPKPDPRLETEEAAAFLKVLSHEGRLLILCHLSEGERSVTQLEQILGTRQAAVSQQLARLRLAGLVRTRRNDKVIRYSIADPRVGRLSAVVNDLFCTKA